MAKILYLARHGETEWNVAGRKQGQLDSPLTVVGERHAHAQAEALAGLGVGRVLTSPLGRAVRTAGIMAGALQVPVDVVDELAEVHHGDYAGATAVDLAGDPHWAVRRDRLYEWTFPGGESYRDVDERAATALSRITTAGEMVVAVVAHEMIGRMLVKNLCDLTPDDALRRTHPHGVIYRWDAATLGISALDVDDIAR